MKKILQTLKNTFGTTSKVTKYMFALASKTDKRLFLMYAIRFIADALSELKTLLLPKLLVDELTAITQGAPASDHLRNIIIYVACTVTAELVSRFLGNISDSHRTVYQEQFSQLMGEDLCLKSVTMDFQYTEDPETLDKRDRAKEGASWYSGGVIGILDSLYYAFYGVLRIITSVTIIAIYCPLLIPVQIIAMAAVMFFNVRNAKIDMQFFLKLAKSNRIFGYVYYELADFRYGKDIRLYNSAEMMGKRAEKFANIQIKLWGEEAHLQRNNNCGGNIANALRDGISYLYMGLLALRGLITLGDFTMCVSSASLLYQGMMSVGSRVQDLVQKCNYAGKYLDFLEYPDALVKGELPTRKDGEHTIEFRDVSFKYPRAKDYVLEHINITINPGEHLSVVGLNGAGKTTFIKLLCRLYDVTEGQILVDGIDIREYSEEEYRELFSVVFQDFMLFAFSLKENIALDDAISEDKETENEESNNEEVQGEGLKGEKTNGEDINLKVEEILKLSGLYEDAVKLDNGLDTMLFKSFDEHGTELSGGQKQKAAISRALYKNAPVVILDEPTAALDPIAEYDIYRKFDTLVGGKSAIYISHRLSSCKFCDKIAVFADKTIKEYGTHADLVNLKDGIYAEMFASQAQYYVENA